MDARETGRGREMKSPSTVTTRKVKTRPASGVAKTPRWPLGRVLKWVALLLLAFVLYEYVPELPPPLAPARGPPQQALWN
jgi:hypothetical protein